MKYAVVGYGRMGRAVEKQALERGHELCARIDVDDLPAGAGISAKLLGGADVAFEFTVPDAAEANVGALLDAGVTVVCGTTGWAPSAALLERARAASRGVVIAPNFSVGMQLFYRLVREAAKLSAATGLYEPFVFELHHRGKRDCPSGTARRLAEILVEQDSRWLRTQEGNPPGALAADAIHVASVRAGHEPGTHVVGFDGAADRITLEHAARSRDALALGAVLAAEWLADVAGLHSFEALVERQLGRGGAAGS